MAVKTFGSEILTSGDVNTYLANSGLVFVKQVTVGSGVTQLDITSCFNSSFDNYVISIQNVSCAASLSFSLQLLSGSTPTSTGWYGTEFFVGVGSVGINGQIAGNNSAGNYCSAGSAASGMASIVDIESPYLAQHTRFEYGCSASDYFRWGFAIHQANTSFDGLRFFTSGSTQITGGTITVYGRRKQ